MEARRAPAQRPLRSRLRAWPGLLVCVLGCGEASGDGAPGIDLGAPKPATVRLEVRALAPNRPFPAGRLAVVWYQHVGRYELSSEIGLDVPFPADARRIEIATRDVRLPSEALWACPRTCDAGECRCDGEPRVAVGVVVVVEDTNHNERVDFHWRGEPQDDARYGIGQFVLCYSETGHAVTPNPFENVFPGGILRGLAPYRISHYDDRPANIGAPAPDELHVLDVCPGVTPDCYAFGPF